MRCSLVSYGLVFRIMYVVHVGVESGYVCYCLLGHLGLTCFTAIPLLPRYLLNKLAGRLAANMLMDRAEHVDPHRGEKAAADPVSILMSRALSCSVYVERIVHLDLDFQEVGNPIDVLP